MEQLLITVYLVLLGLFCVLTTVVFCFWFLYLLQAIIQKRNIYKKALRCLEASNDYTQRIIAWKAETEFVKNIFVFCINIAEWLGFISISVSNVWNHIEAQEQYPNRVNNTEYSPPDSFYIRYLHFDELQPNSVVSRSFEYFAKNLIMLSYVLVSSLSEFLSGRYTQVAWVRSHNIPHTIGIFVIYSVVIQFLTLFNSIEIIALVKWLNTFLYILSLILALKGYRKLIMVINWTIVDLKVRGNKPKLVARVIRMKRKSVRIFTVIMIGAFAILCGEFIHDILITVLLSSRFSNLELLSPISNLLGFVGGFIIILGIILISLPYTIYGLVIMYTILWRLYRGKSGFQTHFPNPQLRSSP